MPGLCVAWCTVVVVAGGPRDHRPRGPVTARVCVCVCTREGVSCGCLWHLANAWGLGDAH